VREGGNERYCENIIRCLGRAAAAEDEYFVFSYRGAARTRIPDGAARLTHLPLARRSVAWQRAVELPLYSRRLDLDVLHVPFNFLPLFRCRKVVTIHDLPFLHLPETHLRLERARMVLLTRLAARRADHVLTVSEFTKRDIVAAYGVDPARITVTPNAADADVFHPVDDAARAAFRRSRGLDFDYLLFVGTLQPRKNLPVLIEAYARLRARGRRDHHLVLVGRKGWLYDDVFRAVRERGLEDVVHHVDAVQAQALTGFYNAATALVMPSRWESFGVPIVEAMSCGCPVVCSTAAAMPEVCGDAALPFHPDSPEELADQLERLLDDGVLRRDLVHRGFANAARFTWDESAARVRAVYHGL
jgi:glycosyltransferase involved in cell wall biosynthesis